MEKGYIGVATKSALFLGALRFKKSKKVKKKKEKTKEVSINPCHYQ